MGKLHSLALRRHKSEFLFFIKFERAEVSRTSTVGLRGKANVDVAVFNTNGIHRNGTFICV
jgi:hypothetical protein